MSKTNLNSRKELWIGKYLDISTAHVTKEDDAKLAAEDCPICCYPYECGYWIYVDLNHEVHESDVPAMGFSQGFADVYMAARQAGCQWIKLDCDGYEYEQFKRYDW